MISKGVTPFPLRRDSSFALRSLLKASRSGEPNGKTLRPALAPEEGYRGKTAPVPFPLLIILLILFIILSNPTGSGGYSFSRAYWSCIALMRSCLALMRSCKFKIFLGGPPLAKLIRPPLARPIRPPLKPVKALLRPAAAKPAPVAC